MFKSYFHKDAHKEPTPFQKKIWDALDAVPAGYVTTYARMAEATGHSSRAAQAAHNAVKAGVRYYRQNLPWYRIVRASGDLYVSANTKKQRIETLRAEGIPVTNSGRIEELSNYLYDYRQ